MMMRKKFHQAELGPMMISITLGNKCLLAIDKDDHLYLIHEQPNSEVKIDLGKATKDRFDTLQEYVKRLSMHAVDE